MLSTGLHFASESTSAFPALVIEAVTLALSSKSEQSIDILGLHPPPLRQEDKDGGPGLDAKRPFLLPQSRARMLASAGQALALG